MDVKSPFQFQDEWRKHKPQQQGRHMADEVLRRPEADYAFAYGNIYGSEWNILAAVGQACWDQTQELLDSIRSKKPKA